ncbi:MAG TPA: copper oxidase [Candidatus Babeliales bacterium]|nr:copper oxidase [Candidatus Babeliales bacterium]
MLFIFLILLNLVFPASARSSDHQHTPTHEKHKHDHHAMPTFHKGWKDPHIPISAPPKTMGKQMGTVDTLGIPALGYTLDGKVKVFTLIAQPVEKLITDSRTPSWQHLVPEKNRDDYLFMHHKIYQKIKCWGFNGSMPGPTIEFNEGDRVRIIVKNELPEPLSIHWHGLELPNDQDGSAGLTQPPIMPGQTYTYEFTVYQSGTFMYHSEFNLMKQDALGSVGMIVVHPKHAAHKIDKDFAIMLQQWTILPGSEYPNIAAMNNPNWATFNGMAAPNIPHMAVKQGERVRIRLANMGLDSHPIHIHGYNWTEVGTDGGPIPESAQQKSSTINVPPGSTRDVEFVAWNPGLWRFHCHKLHHIVNGHADDIPLGLMPHGGMFTILYVEPKDPKAPWKHPNQPEEKSANQWQAII